MIVQKFKIAICWAGESASIHMLWTTPGDNAVDVLCG
jgi:hypothetical protein